MHTRSDSDKQVLLLNYAFSADDFSCPSTFLKGWLPLSILLHDVRSHVAI